MVKITFICTGNICRSPFAEHLLKKISDEKGYNYSITSMGTINKSGFKAPSDAVSAAKEFSIDLSTHESRPMNANELLKSDYIFVLDRTHREYIKTYYPMLQDRVFLLASYKKKGLFVSQDVKDPFKKDIKVFRKVYSEINSHINRILPLE